MGSLYFHSINEDILKLIKKRIQNNQNLNPNYIYNVKYSKINSGVLSSETVSSYLSDNRFHISDEIEPIEFDKIIIETHELKEWANIGYLTIENRQFYLDFTGDDEIARCFYDSYKDKTYIKTIYLIKDTTVFMFENLKVEYGIENHFVSFTY